MNSASLSPDITKVRQRLSTTVIGRSWHVAAELPSTNSVAKQMAAAGAEEGLVVLCERQAAGRGRGSHLWHSPPGGLWFSFLLRPQAVPRSVLRYTALTAAAVAIAVEEVTGTPIDIHWPNDLMVGERKIGGVLCEVASSGTSLTYVVIGVGLNVNNGPETFPPELRPRTTSLVELLGHGVEPEPLLVAILETAERLIFDPTEGGFLRYRARLSTIGHRVSIEGQQQVVGLAIDIDESGQLLVTTATGAFTINHGHCRHLPASGPSS